MHHSLLLSLGHDLLLEDGWLLETKCDLVGGELVVAVGNSGESVNHDFLIQWVEKNLGLLSSVSNVSGGLSKDIRWEAL